MKFSALLILIALTACETVTTTRKSENIYEISSTVEAVAWKPGPEGANIQLNGLAKKNCPNGWNVLNEKSVVNNGKQLIVRTISCL